jgi:hypothetical protein
VYFQAYITHPTITVILPVVSYWYETSFLTLIAEHRLRVLERDAEEDMCA